MRAPISAVSVAGVAILAAPSSARQPLEPESGILFGPWIDSTPLSPSGVVPQQLKDYPVAFNKRFGHNASFFQFTTDFPTDATENQKKLQLIEDTGTTAFLYLTVYPSKNNLTSSNDYSVFDQFTPEKIAFFATRMHNIINSGFVSGLMIRLAPEMNGNWNPWGQRPLHYVETWRSVRDWMLLGAVQMGNFPDWIYTAVMNVTGAAEKVAFLWAPNIAAPGNESYPWGGLGMAPFTSSTKNRTFAINTTEFDALDTNGDHVFDFLDSHYSPYFPGKDFVHWVGASQYWGDHGADSSHPPSNQLPNASYFAFQFGDGNDWSLYQNYSVGYSLPYMISETNANFYQYVVNSSAFIPEGPGPLAIKQDWWRQYITNTTFLESHSMIKGICLFEFQKGEGGDPQTFRDFMVTNDTSPNGTLAEFKADFEAPDVISLYSFANHSAPSKSHASPATTGDGPSNTTTSTAGSAAAATTSAKSEGFPL
ncbi:hypothetical protein BDK51DRAFT_26647, partial [Blyttiomyces helicus]